MSNKTEAPLPRLALRRIPGGYDELRKQYSEMSKELIDSYTRSDDQWLHIQHIEQLLREMTDARDLWIREYQQLYNIHRYRDGVIPSPEEEDCDIIDESKNDS